MHPNEYKTRFLFIHKDLDFSEVREKFSSIPGININDYKVKHHDSRFGFDFETADSWNKSLEKDSSVAIREQIEKLRPFKSLLNELSLKECSLAIIVSVGVDENTSVTISPELSEILAEFKMHLSYDLYPPDVAA